LPDHTGETYHGRKGVVWAMERWIEHYAWLLIELEQIVDAGDRRLRPASPSEGAAHRHRVRRTTRLSLEIPKRQDRSLPVIPGSGAGHGSRRAAGIDLARPDRVSASKRWPRSGRCLPPLHLLIRARGAFGGFRASAGILAAGPAQTILLFARQKTSESRLRLQARSTAVVSHAQCR